MGLIVKMGSIPVKLWSHVKCGLDYHTKHMKIVTFTCHLQIFMLWLKILVNFSYQCNWVCRNTQNIYNGLLQGLTVRCFWKKLAYEQWTKWKCLTLSGNKQHSTSLGSIKKIKSEGRRVWVLSPRAEIIFLLLDIRIPESQTLGL